MHTKIKGICERLTDKLMECLEDIEEADTEEVGDVIDMIKDLCEASYYYQITEAMNESEYGEDYDFEGPKFYRGRSATTGRYVHRPYTKMMDERDMDKEDGRMYYTEKYPMAKGYEDGYIAGMSATSKYEKHKKGYEESKELEDKVKNLDGYLSNIQEDIEKMLPGMSAQEKTMLKNKFQTWQNKVV